jgi:chromosome segregation protein
LTGKPAESVHFDGLRLAGFKSFVEPTEIAIPPGLTGIVGPNGCGKSNLVEALRWVMGANSPKSMRGESMDDVIFSGTSTRPARNLAEVTLHLDNTARRAPAAFNDSAELQITRRLERGVGSSYRINGREVRAKDVQLFFADLMAGARSPAMVRQGSVGAVINAKAAERRVLLEEAAGITGLHARRHEAELRLAAADQNLKRLDDVLAQLEQQFNDLKRQARQASRYRNLAHHLRRTEALVFHLRHGAASAALEAAVAALRAAEAAVRERSTEAAAASAAELKSAERQPPLRRDEAESAARLQRLLVARESLNAEAQRARQAIGEADARLAQIADDEVREQTLVRDAADAIAKLDDEAAALAPNGGDDGGEADEAKALGECESLGAAVAEQQRTLDDLVERAAAEREARARLDAALAEAERRLARLRHSQGVIAAERAKMNGRSGAGGDDESAVNAAAESAAQARAMLDEAERRRLSLQDGEAAARAAAAAVEAAIASLTAEEAAIARLPALAPTAAGAERAIDLIAVEPGYEAALGAALGDDLAAGSDASAPIYWQALPALTGAPALPSGALSLDRYVQAPPWLARRLSQVGVVADGAGAKLQPLLRPGQRLVNRAGAMWRWDGLTAQAGAETVAATWLSQRARLVELRAALAAKTAEHAVAKEQLAAAQAASSEAANNQAQARQRNQAAQAALESARAARAARLSESAAQTSRLASLNEAAAGGEREIADTLRTIAEVNAQVAALPVSAEPGAAPGAAMAELRRAIDARRQNYMAARSALDLLRHQRRARALRLAAIAADRQSWTQRAAGSAEKSKQLAARRADTEAARAAAAERPAEIAQRSLRLEDEITAAERARQQAADRLAEAENQLAALDRATKQAERAHAEAREELVRCQALLENATEQRKQIVLHIAEALDCAPDALPALAELGPGEAPPAIEDLEAKLARLRKERDTMGPVNLRADIEADEIDQRLTTLKRERDDLLGAIERLRQGIGGLNREGRERLLTAFKSVDEHFQRLFVRLFGGGRAHLALTDSDDPLSAGLEIYASPPGKRLQVLSLLSGGEQALTALAMLFAVFLTNPAPLCVLDEVDAPLDDSNVERLCDLLDDLARDGQTRFLTVTHNPLTMARMHRLYGVTMPERGTSTLVSVDLATAEALRATA